MQISPLQSEDFITFVKTLEGQEITSRAGKSQFTVSVTHQDFTFIPLSSGKSRMHQKRFVEKVLDQFNRTHSYVLHDYAKNGIVNATYMLALIGLYLDQSHS